MLVSAARWRKLRLPSVKVVLLQVQAAQCMTRIKRAVPHRGVGEVEDVDAVLASLSVVVAVAANSDTPAQPWQRW
jgi:hypothetical protein